MKHIKITYNMKTYKEFLLSEGKNIGIIYHYTNLKSFIEILNEGVLRPGAVDYDEFTPPFISFTRRKNIIKDLGFRNHLVNPPFVGMEFDGNKLSNKYKIVPFNYYYYLSSTELDVTTKEMNKNYKHDKDYDEDEERLILGSYNKTVPIKNYLRKIYLLDDADLSLLFKNYLKNPEFRNTIADFVGVDRYVTLNYTLQDYYQMIIDNIDDYKFEIIKK